MNTSQSIRRIAVAALVAAFAVVFAAPAQGGSPAVPVRPDDRADRTIAPASQPSAVRPDDRAFRGPGAVPAAAAVRPDDRADRSLPIGSVVALPTAGVGFDWTDAGIGAAAAFGLVLVAAGVSLIGLRHRRAPALP
jgi:hypothetical protein